MTDLALDTPSLPQSDSQGVDGRRERSRSSRSRIVAAMIELVGKGDVSPSAAKIAEVAKVGLRSVFRHFEDMDALYREMSSVMSEQVLPIINQPPVGATWKAQIEDISRRRSQVFEIILPYRLSANLKRFESPYLMQEYRELVRRERLVIEAIVPEVVAKDIDGVRALTAVLSFQTWRLLRHDQELSADAARTILQRLVADVLKSLPDS